MQEDPRVVAGARPVPVALVVLVGALVAGTALGPSADTGGDTGRAAAAERALPAQDGAAWPARFVAAPVPDELERRCARELRALPGLGRVRAAAVARARWVRGPGRLRLAQVPGIGERTERVIEEHLAARRAGALRAERPRCATAGSSSTSCAPRDGPRVRSP